MMRGGEAENKFLGFSGRTNRLGKRVVFTGLVKDNRLK